MTVVRIFLGAIFIVQSCLLGFEIWLWRGASDYWLVHAISTLIVFGVWLYSVRQFWRAFD